MSLRTDEQIEVGLANYRNVKLSERVEKMTVLKIGIELRISRHTIRNWIFDFGIPVERVSVRKYCNVFLNEDNIKAIKLVYELLHVELYTTKGALRQIELRGLLDGKHFLKV